VCATPQRPLGAIKVGIDLSEAQKRRKILS
jgi:hypothetical protein